MVENEQQITVQTVRSRNEVPEQFYTDEHTEALDVNALNEEMGLNLEVIKNKDLVGVPFIILSGDKIVDNFGKGNDYWRCIVKLEETSERRAAFFGGVMLVRVLNYWAMKGDGSPLRATLVAKPSNFGNDVLLFASPDAHPDDIPF